MLEPAVFTVGLVALTATAFAQALGRTQESMASAPEVASAGETLAKIGCVAGAAEDAVFSDFQGAR